MDIVKRVQAMSYVAEEAVNEIEWLRNELQTATDEVERLRDGLQKIADGDVYDEDNKLMAAWAHINLARAVLGKDNAVYKGKK